jgi:hypothetical protein
MDQNDVSLLRQRFCDSRCETRNVLSVQVIDDLGQNNEVEGAVGPLFRHEHLLETYGRKFGASASGLVQRRNRRIDR